MLPVPETLPSECELYIEPAFVPAKPPVPVLPDTSPVAYESVIFPKLPPTRPPAYTPSASTLTSALHLSIELYTLKPVLLSVSPSLSPTRPPAYAPFEPVASDFTFPDTWQFPIRFPMLSTIFSVLTFAAAQPTRPPTIAPPVTSAFSSLTFLTAAPII